MDILKRLNNIRKVVMPGITKNIGNTHFNKLKNLNEPPEINKILVLRPNHRLGNLLLTTPLLEELQITFPNAEIVVLAKGFLGPIVFKNYTNVSKIMSLPKKPFKALINYARVWISVKSKKYDLVVNAVDGSSSGRLLTKFARAKFKIFGEFDQENQTNHDDRGHIAKNPIYNLRHYLHKIGLEKNSKPLPPLDLKLSHEELTTGKQILGDIIKNDKKTISIFTFATGSKCYSKEWWSVFYERLKVEFSDYNIVEVLPVENVSQIDFKAPTFYSKEIREIGAFIANTEVFIGADSGIMHLASASLTPTLGLFSITKIDMYKPYNNNSQAINTNESNLNDWIKIINATLAVNN